MSFVVISGARSERIMATIALFRVLFARLFISTRIHSTSGLPNKRWPAGVRTIDKFIRFVARDSGGRFFLWSMHWGDAGYGCQIATLTPSEERALYRWSARPKKPEAGRDRRPPRIADQAPLSGSFVDTGNALRFFNRNGDPELERWARAMFNEVQNSADN
jgi:hypothetical protein